MRAEWLVNKILVSEVLMRRHARKKNGDPRAKTGTSCSSSQRLLSARVSGRFIEPFANSDDASRFDASVYRSVSITAGT